MQSKPDPKKKTTPPSPTAKPPTTKPHPSSSISGPHNPTDEHAPPASKKK